MQLNVNRILAPVTVLGYGRRIGIWVQGCALACPGCASVDTWDPAEGEPQDVAEVAELVAGEIVTRHLDGISLTGGEPTEQAPALASLVKQVRARLAAAGYDPPVDVLMFTGRPAGAAAKRSAGLWELLDAAVCGPYRRDEPGTDPLLASANQELLVLSGLGEERYPLRDEAARLQVVSLGDQLMLVGLPRPGDLERLESRLNARGVNMGGTSWRTAT